MRMIVPYEKEITFNTKVNEISSISLEFEASLEENLIKGVFILEGEYKVHEVSINKEPFKYKLPFEIDLSEEIDIETLVYDIHDFTYELINEDTLKLNIEFLIDADDLIEERIEPQVDIDEILNQELDNQEKEERKELNGQEIIEENEEVIKENIILNHVNDSMNTYVIYHIYIINENEDIDLVAKKFNSTQELIKEYNEPLNWVVGEKLLIPEIKDE